MGLAFKLLLLACLSVVTGGKVSPLKDSVIEFGGWAPDGREYAYRLTRTYQDKSTRESWHLFQTSRDVPGKAQPKGVLLKGRRFPAYMERSGYVKKTLQGISSSDRCSWTFPLSGGSQLKVSLLTRKRMVTKVELEQPSGTRTLLDLQEHDEIWFELAASAHPSPAGDKLALVLCLKGDVRQECQVSVFVLPGPEKPAAR